MMLIDGILQRCGVDRDTDLTESALLAVWTRSASPAPLDCSGRSFAWRAESRGNDRSGRPLPRTPTAFIPACSANPWFGQERFSRSSHVPPIAGAKAACPVPAFRVSPLAMTREPDHRGRHSAGLPIYVAYGGLLSTARPAQVGLAARDSPSAVFLMALRLHGFQTDRSKWRQNCANVLLESARAAVWGARPDECAGEQPTDHGSAGPPELNDLGAFDGGEMMRVIPPKTSGFLWGNLFAAPAERSLPGDHRRAQHYGTAMRARRARPFPLAGSPGC